MLRPTLPQPMLPTRPPSMSSTLALTCFIVAAAGLSNAMAALSAVDLPNAASMSLPLLGLGVGGYYTAEGVYNDSQAERAVSLALAAGFRAVDTAVAYGNQRGVGRALQQAKASGISVFTTTKVVGCGGIGVRTSACGADTEKQAQWALRELQLRSVDLLLLHTPPNLPDANLDSGTECQPSSQSCRLAQEQWAAMERLQQAGAAKAIGVSNYGTACLACVLETSQVAPAVNQVQLHPGLGAAATNEAAKAISELRAFASRHGIILQAYSPLTSLPATLNTIPEVTACAARLGLSAPRVAIAWLVQLGVPVVTKSSSPSHLADDIDAVEAPPRLDDACMAAISAAAPPQGTRLPHYSAASAPFTTGGPEPLTSGSLDP